MQEKNKLYLPLVLVFVVVNLLALLFGSVLKSWKMDAWVVAGANVLLFLISVYNASQHVKQMNQSNPHAMVRGVMGSTVLKLFVLGTAAFLYLYNAGENKSVNALFFSMGLYILYTWMDVRIALKGNPSKKMASVTEHPMQALAAYLPNGSFDPVVSYLHQYKVHLTVTKQRKSVLGDYRHAGWGGNHRISINGNLNKYEFLITLLHELAHLLIFEQYKNKVEAHGHEWKSIYGNLLLQFIQMDLFPAEIKKCLLKTIKNPAATANGETQLLLVLRKYNAHQKEGFN